MTATSTSPTSSSPVLVLTQHDVNMIIIYLVVLALVVVLQPLILSLTFRKRKETAAGQTPQPAGSFFEIPFITWFLVHYGIAALAVIAIVILGLDGVIDQSTVAALLGSLFGYVLGSASKGSGSQTPPPPTKPHNTGNGATEIKT